MNTLKNTILSTKEAKAKLDHTVKQIFSNRQILARIIKRTVPEFADIRLKDIEETYIEPGSNTISSVAVERNLTNIEGLNTEDTSSNEGTIYYDLLFKAAYPGKEGQMIGMYINIELQNDYYPPYPLESRAAFYAEDRSKGRLTQSNNYFFADLLQTVGKTYGRGGLSFSCRSRVDSGYQDELAIFRIGLFQ